MLRKGLKALCCIVPMMLCVSVFASDSQMFKDALNKGMQMQPEKYIREIPDNVSKEASEILKNMQSTLKEAGALRETITFEPDTGKLLFDRVPDVSKDIPKKTVTAGNDYFGSDERLYIFISSSMPLKLIETYGRDIDLLGIGNNAVFILRGCVPGGGFNGCKDFGPTTEFVKSFIAPDGKRARRNQLWIDPVLFQKYGVTEVPTFVYAKKVERSFDMGSEGDDKRLKTAPQWWKSVGDWSLGYHVKKLADESKAASLENIGRKTE